MKKFILAILILSLFNLANSQEFEEKRLSKVGEFIVINQRGETSVLNHLNTKNEVEKIILKKDIISSVVIYRESLDKKEKKKDKKNDEDDIEKNIEIEIKVIITTIENNIYWRSGANSYAMANASKTYDFTFRDISSAESFTIELLKLCNSN